MNRNNTYVERRRHLRIDKHLGVKLKTEVLR
jgi:hypothetical protein